jgi:hypothetical protein
VAAAFYFSEGTCRPGFDPYLCVQNPRNTEATVHITYMKENGTITPQDITVLHNSRSTVNVRDKLGTGDDSAHDFSAVVTCTNGLDIIVERPMYFNYKGVLLVQNRNPTPANVTVTYMAGDGAHEQPAFKMTPTLARP